MNKQLIDDAVRVLQAFEPKTEPYYLCYSGGKDSDAARILAELSGVNYELHHNLTTVDAPETVKYVQTLFEKYGPPKLETDAEGRKVYRYGDKAFIHLPAKNMWQLIVDHAIPPTRIMRYCCAELKEKGGKHRVKITGVRKKESANRKRNHDLITIIGKEKTVGKIAEENGANFSITERGGVVLNTDDAPSRRVVESCYRTTSTMVNPIIEWTDADVWELLRENGCEGNPLYKDGYKRVGCIGCPLAGGRKMKLEFVQYPKYRKLYVNAFDRMLLAREKKKLFNNIDWGSGEEVMRWWCGDDPKQMTVDDWVQMLQEAGLY